MSGFHRAAEIAGQATIEVAEVAVEGQTGRALKRQVLSILMLDDPDRRVTEMSLLPPRKVINPLFSFLLSQDDNVRWRAVTAFGAVVSNLADQEREGARVIMRRLMWSLNDESGGIGWGAPEAMAEVLARHSGMADEFGAVFVSYLNPDGNFLEYPPLQRGLLWGVARLASVRPECVARAGEYLAPYLESTDGEARGLAALAVGLLGVGALRAGVESLNCDEAEVRLYRENRLARVTVGGLAQEALDLLNQRASREDGLCSDHPGSHAQGDRMLESLR